VRPDFGFFGLRIPRDAAPGPSLDGGRFEFDEFLLSCSRSFSTIASSVAC
jgi:hypothetical protein